MERNRKMIKPREVSPDKIFLVNKSYWDDGKGAAPSAKAAGVGVTTAERILFLTRTDWEKYKSKQGASL